MDSRSPRCALCISSLKPCSLFLQTKKKRSSRRAAADLEEPAEDGMDVDVKPVPIERDLNANFVDDDDLQAALARSRRAKVMKTKKLSPEELAKKSMSILSNLKVLVH